MWVLIRRQTNWSYDCWGIFLCKFNDLELVPFSIVFPACGIIIFIASYIIFGIYYFLCVLDSKLLSCVILLVKIQKSVTILLQEEAGSMSSEIRHLRIFLQ